MDSKESKFVFYGKFFAIAWIGLVIYGIGYRVLSIKVGLSADIEQLYSILGLLTLTVIIPVFVKNSPKKSKKSVYFFAASIFIIFFGSLLSTFGSLLEITLSLIGLILGIYAYFGFRKCEKSINNS